MANSPSARLSRSFWNTFGGIVGIYEDFIGLTEVRLAQQKVLQAEEEFMQKQKLRRENQQHLQMLQGRYKDLQVELERTPRTDDRYLVLLTEEHRMIKEERRLADAFHELENSERDAFGVLSARLRESHERERERGERTKYWSIIGSFVGAVIGILGTTVNNERRMREMRKMVQLNSSELSNIQALQGEMLRNQNAQNAGLVNELKDLLLFSSGKVPTLIPIRHEDDIGFRLIKQMQLLNSAQQEQGRQIVSEISDLKNLIAAHVVGDQETSGRSEGDRIIYVGPEIESLLTSTRTSLERRLQITAVCSVLAIVLLSSFRSVFKEPF